MTSAINPMSRRALVKSIRTHGFAATWLLQYDAMVEGPYVEFLKAVATDLHQPWYLGDTRKRRAL